MKKACIFTMFISTGYILALSACANFPSVSKAYAVDVCAERDSPTKCLQDAERLARKRCPNGYNDWDEKKGPICD